MTCGFTDKPQHEVIIMAYVASSQPQEGQQGYIELRANVKLKLLYHVVAR